MRKVAFTLPALHLSSRHSLCQLLTAQLGHLVPIRCPSSCYDDNMFDPHQGQGRQVEAMLSWKPGPSPRLSQPRFRRIPLRVAGYHSPIHAIHFLVFDAIPGRVFKGKMRHVLDAIATGQLQPSGVLQDMGAALPGGRAVATINIEDDTSGYNIPGGAAAQVAVYTPYAHHLALLRRSCADAELGEDLSLG